MRFIALALLTFLILPASTQAAKLPPVEHLYNADIHLKDFVMSSDILGGSVLGASSDTNAVVTKKLDTVYKSYFRDLSIKPPLDWYADDSYDDIALYTSITDPEMMSEITIERFDGTDLTLADLTGYIKTVCSVCGYTIKASGSTKVAKAKASYVEASNGTYHLKMTTFIKDDIAYIITLTTPEASWTAYKAIMEKSVKSLKIK